MLGSFELEYSLTPIQHNLASFQSWSSQPIT